MGVGLILIDQGVISSDQLDAAIAEQRSSGERLDRVLVRMGFASRRSVVQAMGEQFHLPVVDIAEAQVDDETLGAIPASFAFRQKCIPIASDGDYLTVATSDPLEVSGLDELRLMTGKRIRLVLADEDELERFIRANYGVGGDTLDALARDKGEPEITASEPQAAKEVEAASEASVVKLVNDILAEAIAERATDIHIEPYEHELNVRYRIDGVLQRANLPAAAHRFAPAIISRVKIMASLNIAERRRPQDGRITFRHRIERRVQEFDLRVSVIPMLFGEGVVLRVLSKTAVLLRLEDLGMAPRTLERWDRLIARPHGILLVTGPTGSGKSTTLYSSLNRIVSDEIKAITVEDPVEYHVPGVNQIQVNHRTGLTFSAGLRSILRHDPDVVMVGEVRDKETAETAIQASLTGHLVFTTLHTNDAAGATTRLLDMGVEPFLVSSSVEGILAQRLVRKVCPACAETYEPDHADLPPGFRLPESGTLTRGVGCRECRQTGYRGRLGVYELLTMSDEIRQMIMNRANAPEILRRAQADGDISMLFDDGAEKVRAGVTTINEIARALAG